MSANLIDAYGPALPPSPGPLIGRADELALLHEQLTRGNVRLLTLCGTGGIGKTRLALEVARTVQDDFADGTCFVELAPFREPELVLMAIQARVDPGQAAYNRQALDSLKRCLQRRELLLVLDNFEQVLDAAPLVSELLAACPSLTILATSRAPLRLTWEREFALGPLEVPRADLDQPEQILACPSVALLIERMTGIGLGESDDLDDLAALAAICRRLDGIPLAIELAAARTKVLAPRALLARLERPLELLTGGPRDTPARHQALRNTFDWSYELLTDFDQRLFRHLGAFGGGCSFEAAARVGQLPESDIEFVDALGRLVDSGLVCRVDHGSAVEPRLLLLEPVREYALEQLQARDEHEAALRRHADTYLEFAENGEAQMRGIRQREWVGRMERDHANVLVALRWFIDHRAIEQSLRMIYALCMFWWVHGFMREGSERMGEVLALPMPEPMPQAVAMARASALTGAAAMSFWKGDFETTETYINEALALFGDGGEPSRRAFALITVANSYLGRGDLEHAQTAYERTLDEYRLANDARGIAQVTMNLGILAFHRRDYTRADQMLTDSIAEMKQAGDPRGTAFGLRTLVPVLCQRGDFERAQACVSESLTMWRAVRGRVLLPYLLEGAAILAIARGDDARGLRVAGAAASLREEMDTQPTPVWLIELKAWFDRARERLGVEASARAWTDGQALGLEDAVADALEQRVIAPDPTAPTGLTRRETQVLRLVASGATNKEIANQLRVSVATVERHLANAYAKIGARGRAEATAFAITRGLLVGGRR